MADTSVYKVYQFLNSTYSSAEAWKCDADENYGDKDSVLTKDEFCNFMLNLDGLWTSDFGDTDAAKKDVINRFWASIDSVTTGTVQGKQCSNKNALDETEFNNSQKIMEATEEIDDFMANKYPPTVRGITIDAKKWKESVSAGLLNKVIEIVQNNTEYDLESIYNSVSNKATADYVALDIMPDLIMQELGELSNYKIGSDKVWANILNNYISTISGENSPEKIVSDIQELVQAYIDTAVNNSSDNIELLKKYGYKENGYMNDLQYAVIEKNTRDSIISTINNNNEYANISALYSERKDDVDKIINAYVTNTLKDKKATDFTSSLNNVSEAVANFFQSEELNTLLMRFNLNNSVNSELNKNNEYRTGSIQTIFGTTDPKDIAELIEGYDADTLKSQSELLEKTIDIINKLGNNYLTTMGLPDTMSGKQGETANSVKLTNNSGIKLTYKSNNPLSVSSDGTVTLNTSSAGVFNAVVEIYTEDNIKVGSKTVTASITPDVKFSYMEQDYDLYEIMNQESITFVELAPHTKGYGETAKKGRASLATLLTSIKNGISGVDSSLLEKAYNTIYAKYCGFINSVEDTIRENSGLVGKSTTYYDEVKGCNVTTTAQSNMRSAWDHKDVNAGQDIYEKCHTGTTGLYIGHDKENGRDKYYIFLDLKVLVKDFLECIYPGSIL